MCVSSQGWGCWAAGTTRGWHPQSWGRAGSKGSPSRAGVLPTSGGAGSAGGSGYSSRAQPESLSDEAGGRPVAVPQGGGSSLWGHAGLGRDMSWGERIRTGETLGEAGSRGPSPGHVGTFSTWQQDEQPLIPGRDPEAGPDGMMLSTTMTSTLAEPLQKSRGFWGAAPFSAGVISKPTLRARVLGRAGALSAKQGARTGW